MRKVRLHISLLDQISRDDALAGHQRQRPLRPCADGHASRRPILASEGVLIALTGRGRHWTGKKKALVFAKSSLFKYSLARSALTQLVGEDETGKVFTALAVATGISPLVSGPAIKCLYAATVGGQWPGAFLLASSLVYGLALISNLLLFINRRRLFSLSSLSE